MGRHLTARDIEDVVRLLDGWTGKLTWPALCKACKPVIGTAPTRQTLMKFTRVSTAFKIHKGSRSGAIERPEALSSPSEEVYAKRLMRLQRENERLANENRQLLHQFVVWQYNAYARGLSVDELNNSLPSTKQSSPKNISRKPKPRTAEAAKGQR